MKTFTKYPPGDCCGKFHTAGGELRKPPRLTRGEPCQSRRAVAFMRAVPYAIGSVLPPLVVWSAMMGGAWTWLPVVVMFAGVPVADALMRQHIPHPSAQEIIELDSGSRFGP